MWFELIKGILCVLIGIGTGFCTWIFWGKEIIESRWMPMSTYLYYQKRVFIATMLLHILLFSILFG